MDLRRKAEVVRNEISRLDSFPTLSITLTALPLLEMAMTLMNSYKEKGYLVRRIVFVHSILLYNSMSNFTDHEFDREGLIRKVYAATGQCDINPSASFSNRRTLASSNSLATFSTTRPTVNPCGNVMSSKVRKKPCRVTTSITIRFVLGVRISGVSAGFI
jgi:hypothetical protein